jgi:hypothetical protein
MESSYPILTELRLVSPAVAEIPKNNPYSVPEGYFEGFADRMLLLVTMAADPIPEILLQARQMPFTVPDGYFSEFSEKMLSLVNAEEPLPAILSGTKELPYRVPAGYFDAFADNMPGLARKKEDMPEVLSQAKQNTYKVPDGYFEGFAEKMLSKAKATNPVKPEGLSASEELDSISPLLSGLQKNKTNPFSVPEGYFEAPIFAQGTTEELSPVLQQLKNINVYKAPADYFDQLPSEILNRVNDKKPARIIRANFGFQWIRYAAAAVLAGILITTALFIFRPATPATELAQKDAAPADIEQKLEQTSDEAIFSYLDEQDISYVDPALTNTGAELDEEAIQTMFADISDAAIEQYLDQQTDTRQPLTN